MKIKAETVEQYHVLQHIKKHFETEHLEIELVDPIRVEVTDKLGESLCFVWNGSKVVVEERQ